MTSSRDMPNLLIIGSMKSGTSYLHQMLNQHPDVFMCSPKEPAYFARDHRLFVGAPKPLDAEYGTSERLDAYLSLFADAGDARYRGESSTAYTKLPYHEGTAQLIHQAIPDARLIYLMRDPVDRVVSHYFHQRTQREEVRDISSAVESNPDYLNFSDYVMQLRPYLQLFPREQLYFLTFEDLIKNPLAAINHIFEWLELEALPALENARERVNEGQNSVPVTSGLGLYLSRLNTKFKSPALNSLIRRIDREMSGRATVDVSEVKNRLRQIVQPRVDELASMLDMDFSIWR